MQLDAACFWWKLKSNHLLNYRFNLESYDGAVFVVSAAAKVFVFKNSSIFITWYQVIIVFDYRLPSYFVKYFRLLRFIPTKDRCKSI